MGSESSSSWSAAEALGPASTTWDDASSSGTGLFFGSTAACSSLLVVPFEGKTFLRHAVSMRSATTAAVPLDDLLYSSACCCSNCKSKKRAKNCDADNCCCFMAAAHFSVKSAVLLLSLLTSSMRATSHRGGVLVDESLQAGLNAGGQGRQGGLCGGSSSSRGSSSAHDYDRITIIMSARVLFVASGSCCCCLSLLLLVEGPSKTKTEKDTLVLYYVIHE